ncbi:MAG: hypothetical protein AB7O52_07915 [Planctomycetota bacterium]
MAARWPRCFTASPAPPWTSIFIVDANERVADQIISAFPSHRYYLPPHEVLSRELARPRNGSFQILDKEAGLEAYVYVAGSDPLQAFGFANKVHVEVANHRLVLAPPTYMVMIKLLFYSMSQQAKHLDDIAGILRISPDKVDRDSVTDYAAQHGVLDAWRCCSDRDGSSLRDLCQQAERPPEHSAQE